MIVPSMTVQEIHKELFEDVKNLRNKIDDCRKDFKKIVLRSSHCPITISYDCKTKEKKNLFVITFTAMKRSDWKKPILDIYGIYIRAEGNYAAALTLTQLSLIKLFFIKIKVVFCGHIVAIH